MAKILGFGLVQLMPTAPVPVYRQIMPLSPSLVTPSGGSMTVPATPIVSIPSLEPTAVPAASTAPPVPSYDAPSSDAVTAPQAPPSTLLDASRMQTMQEDIDIPGSGLTYADEEVASEAPNPLDNKMVMGAVLLAGLGLVGYVTYSVMKKPTRATANRARRAA
jgi:hypothetical protein